MARLCGLLALAFLCGATALELSEAEPEMGQDNGAPVGKVVELLRELKSKVEKDGEVEQKQFDKYSCWCEETTRRKAYQIEGNMRSIKHLGTAILTLKGKSATRQSEVKLLKKDVAENEDAQDRATAMRQKSNKAFLDEKAEMEETIGALEKGIMALSGAGTHAASLLGVKLEAKQMMQNLRSAVFSAPAEAILSPSQLKTVSDFLQDGAAAANPQSATIQGILKDMYETFATNLEKNTRAESDSQQAFEDVMAVKEKTHDTLTTELKKKEAELSDFNAQLAAASEEMDDTSKEMKASTQFFDSTKKACTSKAHEWSERTRARFEELAGITKALDILTSDEAKETFSKAIKPGSEKTFLQLGSTSHKAPRAAAIATLKKHARNSHSMRLALLANQLRTGGHFDLVVEEVQKMMAVLKTEEKDDQEQRDWCKEETFGNEQEASRMEYKIEKKQARITKLRVEVENLESALAETIRSSEETTTELHDMEEQRNEDHQAFEQAKADDEAAVSLLEKAIESLRAYHKNNKSFLLQEEREDPPPDATFSSKGKTKGESKGIVSILEMIKEDLEAEIKNGVKSEKEAQKQFMDDAEKAHKTIDTLADKATNLRGSISIKNQSIDDTTLAKEDTQTLLDEEREYLASIKPDCDWMLKNFDSRRAARSEEMDGLLEAKALMEGASAQALMQTHTSLLRR